MLSSELHRNTYTRGTYTCMQAKQTCKGKVNLFKLGIGGEGGQSKGCFKN